MNKSLHNIPEDNPDKCPSLCDSDASGSSEGMVLNNTPHDTLLDNPDMFHLLYDSDAHDSSVDTLSYTFLHSSLGKDNLVNVKNKNGIG